MDFNKGLGLSNYVMTEIKSKLKAENLNQDGYEVKVYVNQNVNTSDIVYSIYFAPRTCIKVCIDYSKVPSLSDTEFLKLFYLEVGNYTKENTTNIKEEENMKKSQQEIDFEQFETQRRADVDAKIAKYKTEMEKDIEEERCRLLEEQRKAEAEKDAAGYWYFYTGLINAGFNEDQAMQILLAKK